jgi:hypothetical protein
LLVPHCEASDARLLIEAGLLGSVSDVRLGIVGGR